MRRSDEYGIRPEYIAMIGGARRAFHLDGTAAMRRLGMYAAAMRHLAFVRSLPAPTLP